MLIARRLVVVSIVALAAAFSSTAPGRAADPPTENDQKPLTDEARPDPGRVTPTAHGVTVGRYWGADRYATAAVISQHTFDPDTTPEVDSLVYVATGQNFPDALAASAAAAAYAAPVLLVRQDFVPSVTAQELQRLNRDFIVIAGGPASVSLSVESQLAAYAPYVIRESGADRYATAVAISQGTYTPDTTPEVDSFVYIATGEDYPDALAASAAAGTYGMPVLLVRRNLIPTVTAQELDRLNPDFIVIAGGTASVSAAVETGLAAYAPAVARDWGPDRYATAAAISFANFDPVDIVFVATGRNFPDALAGGAAAGTLGAPMLLVPGNTLPQVVRDELSRLDPLHVIVLGGPSMVSDGVIAEIEALLGG